MLTGSLAYQADRASFAERHQSLLDQMALGHARSPALPDEALQAKQQAHFDWYAANPVQSYLEYEQMPFWAAADALAFGPWRQRVERGSWLVDVGCGNGRSTFRLLEVDLDVHILAFDVSKQAIREAQRRLLGGAFRTKPNFFVADASRFPIRSNSVDYVLAYGVLHHLPDPRATCREIARALKPLGTYFGQENNDTLFRPLFDTLHRFFPLWHEEAGPEAIISIEMLREAFCETGVEVRADSSVFLPPHLINALPRTWGVTLLRWADLVGRAVPGLRSQGGVLIIEGHKAQEANRDL